MYLKPSVLGYVCLFFFIMFSWLTNKLAAVLCEDSAVFLIELFDLLLLHRQAWCAVTRLLEPPTTYPLKSWNLKGAMAITDGNVTGGL